MTPRIVQLNRRHLQAGLLNMLRKTNPELYQNERRRLRERGESDLLFLLDHPERINPEAVA